MDTEAPASTQLKERGVSKYAVTIVIDAEDVQEAIDVVKSQDFYYANYKITDVRKELS